MHYGVQKLIAINSGNYVFAELDLGKPVHLAAPNNRGKSTLVNALQFLYIDDFLKMKFGKRSHEDTKRHYFGDENAYLIFECRTPTGIQCMLVRGLSNLRGGHFERYVYDGAFREGDYVDEDREIRAFQGVQSELADRHLVKVKKSELWHVLGSSVPTENGNAAPRLNILPIRKREEYDAFRDVFTRLLFLSAVDARTLKQLIIDSHARDLGERRIDIAAEYREDFEQIERSDKALQFLHSVADIIDKGRELRLELRTLIENINKSANAKAEDASRCHELLESEVLRLTDESAHLELAEKGIQEERDASLRSDGVLRQAANGLAEDWNNLLLAHDKWKSYSPPFIKEMRHSLQQKNLEVIEIQQGLDQAAAIDLKAMEARVIQLKQQLVANTNALQKWNTTAASELRRAGVTDVELVTAFRVLNPDLLKLIVDDTVSIRDPDAIKMRVKEIASRIKKDRYKDAGLTADLSGVPGPDESSWRDKDSLKNRIALDTEDLRRQESRLDIGRDQAKARKKLTSLQAECASLHNELSEFDSYSSAWSSRKELEKQKSQAQKEVKELEDKISRLNEDLKSNTAETKKIAAQLQSIKELKGQLSAAASTFHEAMRRLNIETNLSETDATEGELTPPAAIPAAVRASLSKLQNLTRNAQRVETLRGEIRSVQAQITEKSRNFEAQLCYFGDEEEEWERLIDGRESLPQREEANQRNWDALIRTLGARLNGIVIAMRNIKLAIERLNAGLKAYRVSNLRAVEIQAEEVHDIYSPLEALAGADSLFQDREAIDFAKVRLRRMIDANQVIELPSLFEIRIRTQLADGTSQHAESLDEIGSTGTGMTVKAMIFVQLIRAVARDKKYRLHFYLDGLGELDDQNLSATAAMAVSQGIIPITADPRLHLEPLAHPEVTVYSLGQNSESRFFIDKFRTYHARRSTALTSPPLGAPNERS
ncbi:MAG: hypothetical protein AB7G28_19710 [Pirellulales bacterium]